MNKGKLHIGFNGVVFVSPITGNGFAGPYWWSIKAFFRLLPCLIWVGSPLYQLLFIRYRRSLGKVHGNIFSIVRDLGTWQGNRVIRPCGYLPKIQPYQKCLAIRWLWWILVIHEVESIME